MYTYTQKCAPRRAPMHPPLLPATRAGPSGTSVREIMRVTGAEIKSWTENRTAQQLLAAGGGGSSGGAGSSGGSSGGSSSRRPCRMLVVEGEEEAVLQAVNVIVAAVDRYKDLCEGRYQGESGGGTAASLRGRNGSGQGFGAFRL